MCENKYITIDDPYKILFGALCHSLPIESIRELEDFLGIKVVSLLEKRIGPKLVSTYIEDITTPEERKKFEEYNLAQKAYRVYGTGKPSKKDRRNIDDFLKDWN